MRLQQGVESQRNRGIRRFRIVGQLVAHLGELFSSRTINPKWRSRAGCVLST